MVVSETITFILAHRHIKVKFPKLLISAKKIADFCHFGKNCQKVAKTYKDITFCVFPINKKPILTPVKLVQNCFLLIQLYK